VVDDAITAENVAVVGLCLRDERYRSIHTKRLLREPWLAENATEVVRALE
jgi:hypothetical protein